MNENEFHFACSVVDDYRKLIATGKSQRWDVVKWTVTVNVALATAAIALKQQYADAAWLFVVLAIFIAVVGVGLMLEHNRRLTATRNASVVPEIYLTKNEVDVATILGSPPKPIGFWYDKEELVFLLAITLLSVLPTYLVFAV